MGWVDFLRPAVVSKTLFNPLQVWTNPLNFGKDGRSSLERFWWGQHNLREVGVWVGGRIERWRCGWVAQYYGNPELLLIRGSPSSHSHVHLLTKQIGLQLIKRSSKAALGETILLQISLVHQSWPIIVWTKDTFCIYLLCRWHLDARGYYVQYQVCTRGPPLHPWQGITQEKVHGSENENVSRLSDTAKVYKGRMNTVFGGKIDLMCK